ncbi:HAMP domain-containing sensor histidine kinase [Bacillus sp. Marseille-P3661]|uniref:HAMP domain-containing sensor histidine kinase n=1 Tax=Bacillus sp. Marseille-P3661 TaxID=1936234 RepID=UPI000C82E5EF|nr:HAMP domain-containing sensor histidine kinase [Bacillus sp. Marseille-P3661]
MAIKWKNKLKIAGWLALFTFGLIAVFLGVNKIETYVNRDYFHTDQFENELNQFIDYLSMFELSYIPKEEVKKVLTVTSDDIEEHRYRYGDLSEQIASIQNQYEHKIQDAQATNRKDIADIFIAERDAKIADITNNFKSDEYVREKIIKEKEGQVDEHYKELEKNRNEFNRYKGSFQYYLKDTTTGKVYTNLNIAAGKKVEDVLNTDKIAYKKSYSSSEGYLSTYDRYHYFRDDNVGNLIHDLTASTYEGQIVIPQSAAVAQSVLQEYYDFQQKQMIFFIYVAIGLTAFAVSLYLMKKMKIVQAVKFDKWQNFYNQIPIDVGVIVFLISGFIMLFSLVISSEIYLYDNVYFLLTTTLSNVMVTSIFVIITFIQGQYLYVRLKGSSNIKSEWKTSLVYRFREELAAMFLNRRVGTQLFLLLSVVFAFGLGAAVIVVEPVFMLIYIPVFLVIGFPVIILLIKRIGYFNRIIYNASELAKGNFEPDLPITGKSVLAKLAENINTLKHGVKISQKAQAKSERLKTELITNVSHDLRTPLTSIITYTELLKSSDLAPDERDSYVEIIDRKSKRLKVLIDDLFEATKMASGNIELTKEKVDLVQLLQQSLAEYDETIEHSTLIFRVTTPENPLYAVVDGQKLWRVFDNLIGNILKYSLENTRVYIAIKLVDNQAEITFKNVTKYELGDNIDEMFERFKRGDTSRHTEGSGLGLAIAKSIIDLHEGNMDIEIDGDLFKVTILLNIH